MIVCRVLIFLLSIKWRKFTRLSIFIDITIYWLESFLPIEMPMMEYYSTFKLIGLILSFILSYFYWTPTLIYCVLASALWHLNRALLYEESVADTMIYFIGVTIWFVINIFVTHLVITWVGKLFAKAQVLKSGNENILENLEEGVVILDESDRSEILYFNLAATGCKRHQMSDLQTEGPVTQILSKPNVAEMLQENNLKQFAPVRKSIFTSTTADTSAVVQ